MFGPKTKKVIDNSFEMWNELLLDEEVNESDGDLVESFIVLFSYLLLMDKITNQNNIRVIEIVRGEDGTIKGVNVNGSEEKTTEDS